MVILNVQTQERTVANDEPSIRLDAINRERQASAGNSLTLVTELTEAVIHF